MALKTQPTKKNVITFLNAIEKEQKRNDALAILNMMQEISGDTPVIWGENIIGFGQYSYITKSGSTGEWFKCGFSPRKTSFSLYLMGCDIQQSKDLLNQLGKHKTGVGCLYLNKLDDINLDVLSQIIQRTIDLQKDK